MTNSITPTPSNTPTSNKSKKQKDKDRPPWLVFAIFLVAAIVVLGLLAWSISSAQLFFTELLLAAGAASVGGLLGFLFGMPRAPADIRSSNSAGSASSDGRYRPSNNLEQISDWLTKILIGVGLVEISHLRGTLSEIGRAVAVSVAGAPAATNVVTQVVVVTFVVLGFLVSFLWTRIYYGPLQTRVDKSVEDSLRGQLEQEREEKERMASIANSMATGEIAVPSVSPPSTVKKTARSGTRGVGQWIPEIAKKMEEFKSSPPLWNSDPGARLFPSAPQESNGRTLEAEVVLDLREAVVIELRVRQISGEEFMGQVAFLLHPTFSEPIVYEEPVNGVAEVRISSAGWFTVVAIADGGETVLSYNLKNLPNAPAWFKKN